MDLFRHWIRHLHNCCCFRITDVVPCKKSKGFLRRPGGRDDFHLRQWGGECGGVARAVADVRRLRLTGQACHKLLGHSRGRYRSSVHHTGGTERAGHRVWGGWEGGRQRSETGPIPRADLSQTGKETLLYSQLLPKGEMFAEILFHCKKERSLWFEVTTKIANIKPPRTFHISPYGMACTL